MIYEFVCDECGKHYETDQKMNDSHEYTCECGEKTRRIYTATPHKVDFRHGYDVGLGKYIDNKKQREDVRREKGLLTEHELREIL